MTSREPARAIVIAALLVVPFACKVEAQPEVPRAGEVAAPQTFVERETQTPRQPVRPSGAAPIDGLDHWARPTLTTDEFLDQARARGIEPRHRVEVSTMAELLAALAPETVILLRPGRYVFEDSDALGDDQAQAALPDWSTISPHYRDHGFHDLNDVAIVGLGPDPAVIIQPDSYAPALHFEDIQGLALYNLAIGHRPEQGWCQGGVIRLVEAQNVLIEGSTLFGSGTEGLSLVTVDGLTLRDSVITDCSEQFSTISNSLDVVYERVDIMGNRGDLLRGFAIYKSTVTLVDSTIADNHPLGWGADGLFAIDGEFDWGKWFVDSPRELEPGRRASEVVLTRTSVDGELVDRTLSAL